MSAPTSTNNQVNDVREEIMQLAAQFEKLGGNVSNLNLGQQLSEVVPQQQQQQDLPVPPSPRPRASKPLK